MTAATGQESYHKPYQPLPGGFISVDYNDIDVIRAATSDHTCAVMVEPVQGEGGVNIPDNDYLMWLRAWCDEKGILLILDEIQTGIGRIGSLFGYQEYGVEPDIMTLAKGLGSGVPIGAFLAKEHASVFVPGDHGSTFGGNPLTCAAAHATVKYIIDNDICANVKKVGQRFIEGLNDMKRKYGFVTEVRGRGLLVAMEFDSDIGQSLLTACLENGLLVNRVKPNALRFMPPLIIGYDEVDEALEILGNALSSIER
jgi:acetylornithine/N-succinyldiaminopimelate aminotransferase